MTLVDKQDDNEELPFNILTLWHNSFDDIVGQRKRGNAQSS